MRGSVPRSAVVAAGAVFLLLEAQPAAADEEPFSIGSRPAWYLLGGATSGGTVASADKGAFVGGELSFVRLREGRFFGFYGDGYYDFGVKGAYTTGGIELGYKFVGLDGGGALRFVHERVEPGATGRLFFTLGILSIYGRYIYLNADRDEHVVQVGGLIKFPLLSPLGVH
jgi:hypothetical protein